MLPTPSCSLASISTYPCSAHPPLPKPRQHCWTTTCSASQSNQHRSGARENVNFDSSERPIASLGRRQLLYGAAAGGAALWIPGAPRPAAASEGLVPVAEDLQKRLEERITEFTLPSNGMHFIVMERHNAPIVSCNTYANVGAFDEEDGRTGLAHLLEHMAFKGTARIGATEFAKESKLLDALDEVFYDVRAANDAGLTAEAAKLAIKMPGLQEAAAALTIPNAFGALLQRQGAVGLNAATSHDATRYFVSLPVNKLELWFAMESERFLVRPMPLTSHEYEEAPVWRELYSEKRVVLEERRLRVDNSPMGKFQEGFAAKAMGNNYSRPVIGVAADVERLGRREVDGFFKKFYGPKSLTVTIVGDVDPAEVQKYAERYFGSWRGSPGALPSRPVQESEVSARPSGGPLYYEEASRAGPAALHAYYRPGLPGKDSVTLDAISNILSGSRTSRLYRTLVEPGYAVSASAASAYPSDKHSTAFLVYGNGGPGTDLDRLAVQLQNEVDKVASGGATAQELMRVKKGFRMELLEAFASNSSLAGALGASHALTGTWRSTVSDLARVESLTSAEIQRVAADTFSENNRFVGRVLPLRSTGLSFKVAL